MANKNTIKKDGPVNQKKLGLYDKIFKPEVIVLESGNSIVKYSSRTPLYLIIFLLVVYFSMKITHFDMGIIVKRGHQLSKILSQVFSPDWSYFSNVVKPLVDTVQMSVIGSAIGSALSLPFAILASININPSKTTVSILRVISNLIRTLPTLIIASVCALIFGLGPFAGAVAISIFTFGVVSRMLYESIETIDMGAFEAMMALGSTRFKAFWVACMPQILPTYLSHSLYSLEMNIRAAAILGYVGAGGLGIIIQERIGWRDYHALGMILLSLFVVVFVIENLSQYLRRKLS